MPPLIQTLLSPEWLAKISREVHKTSCEKGWWGENAVPETTKIHKREFGEILILATSELTEALEVYRDGTDLKKTYWSKTTKSQDEIVTKLSDTPVNGWKPEGFPIEIADFIIRNIETMAAAGTDVEGAFNYAMLSHEFEKAQKRAQGLAVETVNNVPFALARINYWIARAEERYRTKTLLKKPVSFVLIIEDDNGTEGITFFLASAVNLAILLCEALNIDIEKAILMKMEYNSTRPYKHGGKLA